MRCLIRYSSDKSIPDTAPDSDPRVQRGEATEVDLFEVRLLPPVSPTKIVCVGRNYADHAKELGNAVPQEPLIFLKPPSSLAASGSPIVCPKSSAEVHYEGELGIVIGRRARNVSAAEAMSYVLGFTIVNDVTARDLQKKDGQWTRGKGFDTFCPVGPWVVPKEDVELSNLRIVTRVNGGVKQDAPVSDMLFSPAAIIEFVTQFMTLEPGDLIATGTPPGVGPLRAGDEVEVEIPGIGTLSNPVVEALP